MKPCRECCQEKAPSQTDAADPRQLPLISCWDKSTGKEMMQGASWPSAAGVAPSVLWNAFQKGWLLGW